MAVLVHGGGDLPARLCRAVGLDPATTRKLVIEVAVDKLVQVYAVTAADIPKLAAVAEQFEVTRVADVEVSDESLVVLVQADTPPANCDCCGKADDQLSQFSGWKHDPGESDWLCEQCYDNAKVEE